MRLVELVEKIGISYSGEDCEIVGINTLRDAKEDELSFLDNPKYLKDLGQTKAAAVLVSKKYESAVPKDSIALVDDEPYLKLAFASKFFAPEVMKKEGNEPKFGKNCNIGSNVSFGKDVVVGDRVTIMPGCFIGDDVEIGDDTVIYPNVTIYHQCKVGSKCIIHSGTVIGSDGYGFAHTKDGKHIKLYQLGNVVIEDDVEIGSNCSIDRGALKSTVIKEGVKIDNLVHIAHNCEIGEHSLITGQVGISGSTKLGRNVVMGGQSGTAGHLEIGPFATIAARGGVTKSIPGNRVYAGFPLMEHKKWLKLNAMLSKFLRKSDTIVK
ncbi:UDP-3-O-(3-hydroxymyristoyl)glucosamine N-acyltransferase [Hydrogenimonas thermophila]|uniref:UDP-3-O-acylglucosamine N-acyltransferase n=1 Tax=Hydrogenimonas thermophila TaxID=223786 RepID=A0A1I5SNH2_9BACT|nr:UDP-3-O-(3-hydroxymyristoyl)glucosamine N-acyltransferase [Hydrogenimonas thermophila]SFP72265.1 UDP-3-O-[3-hydroxymyristoyl] glucosamine N-acyltransferase [Hydrogenimonas thermophila]